MVGPQRQSINKTNARGLVQWRAAAWVGGGALLVLAALLLYIRFDRGCPEPIHRPGMERLQTEPATATSPADVAAEPLAGIGLEVLHAGADDIFAPPGAVRRHAFRRKINDEATDIVAYAVKAEIADVEKFYSDRLTEAGYKLAQKRATMHTDGVSLMFLRDLQRYCVTLRYADKEKKIVKIVLIISRPGRPGYGALSSRRSEP